MKSMTPGSRHALKMCALLAGLAGAASASFAAVTASLVPTRTSGVAPLAVYFDTTGTTSTVTSTPFHDLYYEWDYGDPGSGIWATSGKSRNRDVGPNGGHVFESPGSYTVTLIVTDSTGAVDTETTLITVHDPDMVFSGTNTICFSTTADFSGAPSGAQTITTSSWDTITSALGTGRRVLLHRGQTWNHSGTRKDLTFNGPGILGAFGTGAKPVVRLTSSANNKQGRVFWMGTESTPGEFNDFRFIDLEIDGEGHNRGFIWTEGSVDNITFLRVSMRDGGPFIFIDPVTLNGNNSSGEHTLPSGIAMVDTSFNHIIGDGDVFNAGHGAFLAMQRFLLMGNDWDDTELGEHVLRLPFAQRGVIAHNRLQNARATKHVIKLHATERTDTLVPPGELQSKYLTISDNYFYSRVGVWNISIGPRNGNFPEVVQDVILERNEYAASAESRVAFHICASRVTVRNNAFVLTGMNANIGRAVEISRRGVEPVPTGNRIYNNSAYHGGPNTFRFVEIHSSAVDTTVRNNFGKAPGGDTMISGSGTNLQQSNNLITNSPGWVAAAPTDALHFELAAGSVAINAGTGVPVLGDYEEVPRPQGGTWDMGAFEFIESGSPTAPSDLAATAVSSTQVDLTWTDNASNETQFRIERKTGAGSYDLLTTKGANITSHSDTTAAASTAYTYRVRAENATGNSAFSNEATATTPSGGDTTPPTVGLTAPNDSATVSGDSVAVSANASDNVGVVGVQFKLDGVNLGAEDTTSPYGISWDTTTTSDGSHALTAVARDAAGNTTTSSAITVTVDNNGGAPVVHEAENLSRSNSAGDAIALISPTGVSGQAVRLTGDAVGDWVEFTLNIGSAETYDVKVQVHRNAYRAIFALMVDGTQLGSDYDAHSTTLGVVEVDFGSRSLSAGNHTFRFQVTDRNPGSSATDYQMAIDTITLTPAAADTTPPEVSMTAPADSATVSGSAVTVSADASDNVGVVGVQFKLDGMDLGTEDTTSPYGISWDTTAADAGSHTLTAVARDAAGNSTTSSGVTVTVADQTAPTVSMTEPADSATVSGTAVIVSAEASDDVGVVGVQFKLDGVNLGAEDTTSPFEPSINWDTTTTSDGSHTLTAVARDAAGNTITSSAITVTVDNNGGAPVVYEAENLSRSNSAGDAMALITPTGVSGQAVRLTGDAVGDWVEFTLNVGSAGTYDVKVQVHRNAYRAIFALIVDGAQLGSDYDAHSTTLGVVEANFGSRILSAGNHTFRFQVTGRNAGSSATDYQIAVDLITLTPTGGGGGEPVDMIIDNVDPEVTFSGDGAWWSVTTGSGYHGADFNTTHNSPSRFATYAPALAPGAYEIFVRHGSSWNNYGTDCPFIVNHTEGATTVPVDQTVNGGTWISIGVFNLDSSSTVVISADLSNDKRPGADAIRFVSQ